MRGRKQPVKEMPQEHVVALTVLGIAFVIGGVIGCLIAFQVGQDNETLLSFLQSYLNAAKNGDVQAPNLMLVLWKAIRFPVLAMILGFTALGIAGMPALFLVRGFLFSFSVTCFVVLYGGRGAIAALLLLGLSSVVTIPVLFIVGTQGMTASRKLLSRYLSGRREHPIYTRPYFLRWGICAIVMGICIALDYTILPKLIQLLASVI